MQNRTVFVDTGIGLAFPGGPNQTQHWDNPAIHTELELEVFLRQGTELLNGSFSSGVWNEAAFPLHRYFAAFEHLNYLAISAHYPCPGDNEACGPGPSRPPRALWMYDMLDDPQKPEPLCTVYPSGRQCNVLVDKRARARFFAWCAARNIVELYIDSGIYTNATLLTALEGFVAESDARGIDIQLLVASDINDSNQAPSLVFERVRAVADWCKRKPRLCGGWPCGPSNNWCRRPQVA